MLQTYQMFVHAKQKQTNNRRKGEKLKLTKKKKTIRKSSWGIPEDHVSYTYVVRYTSFILFDFLRPFFLNSGWTLSGFVRLRFPTKKSRTIKNQSKSETMSICFTLASQSQKFRFSRQI